MAARGDQTGPFEISEVTRDSGLHHLQAGREMTNTNLAIGEEIEQPETIGIAQALQERNEVAM